MRFEIAKSISRKILEPKNVQKNPTVTLSLGSCYVKFPVDDAYQKILKSTEIAQS